LPEKNTNEIVIEILNSLEKLRGGSLFESTARIDHYYEVISEELDQIGLEKEEDGRPEYSEEILLILKQFLEEQGENFRSYLQTFNLQPILSEMGEMLRRMLISLQSVQIKIPGEKESKRGFFQVFRRIREDDLQVSQNREIGGFFARVYEDVRRLSQRKDEKKLFIDVFFGMIDQLNWPDKNVLMAKYHPILESSLGLKGEQNENE